MPSFRSLNQSAAFGFPGFASQPGSLVYAPGTYTLLVPPFRNMSIEAWGAGGGGGSTGSGYGGSGGNSIVTLPNGIELAAGGGAGGQDVYSNRWHRGYYVGDGGGAGLASGGDINLTGGLGGPGGVDPSGSGGQGGSGAAGGAGGDGGNWLHGYGRPGGFPGGGGGGWNYGYGSQGGKFSWDTGGGGGGAYVKKIVKIGKIHPHSIITIVVGAGGTATKEGGAGGNGRVTISWT